MPSLVLVLAAASLQLSHASFDDPAPAPDGKRIAFTVSIAGRSQLFVGALDLSGATQLTRDAWDHDSPAWSPDGAFLAYVSGRSGHAAIHVVKADGTGDEALTSETSDSIHPTWSPDGKSVLYCSDDDLRPPAKNPSEIYSVEVGTRRIRKLISGGTNTYPSWSPDGKKILFRRMAGEKDSEVFVADPDGSHAVNLTRDPAFDGWPAWSPEGKRIAFASNRANPAVWQIYVMDADGGHVTRVAETEGRATVPRWSPDGRQIYFTVCRKIESGADCHIHRAAAPQ
jgi:TolB protein